MTEYVVFQSDAGWKERARVNARSAQSAIRFYIEQVPGPDEAPLTGEFVAVPARSWRPVTVKVETKTALRFS